MSVNNFVLVELPGFQVETTDVQACTLTIRARAITSAAQCPACSIASERVHSYYTRSPSDWPISGRGVRLY